MSLKFTKMHGLGNDFMVVDAQDQPFDLNAKQIQALANRHTGIGFDQLLLIEPATNPTADFYYRIFNADGGEVNQCGNGARCVARFLQKNEQIPDSTLVLQTHDQLMNLQINPDQTVTVGVCVPNFSPDSLPFVTNAVSDHYELLLNDKTVQFGIVSVGNPHAVVTVDCIDSDDLMRLGAILSHDHHFKQGVNVGFMQVESRDEIRLRVYERGVGETLACGSGACAAVAVGIRQGVLSSRVLVKQAGGDLIIEWSGANETLAMTGPAEFVYQGVLT